MPHLHPWVAYPTPQMEGGRGWAGWIRFLWISSVLTFHRALSGGILYWGRHQFSVFHFETFSSVTVLVSNHSSVLFIYLSHFIRFRTRGYHNFVVSVLPSLPKIHPNKPKNAIFNSCVSCCLSVTKRKNTCFCWMTTTFFLLTKNVVKIMNNEQVWKSLLMSIFICSFKKYFSQIFLLGWLLTITYELSCRFFILFSFLPSFLSSYFPSSFPSFLFLSPSSLYDQLFPITSKGILHPSRMLLYTCFCWEIRPFFWTFLEFQN